jgi:hypothetical protein
MPKYLESAPMKQKRPNILKRIRLAADKFLPEPLRINKPPIAIIEEKIEQAESAQMIETSGESASPKLRSPQTSSTNSLPKSVFNFTKQQSQTDAESSQKEEEELSPGGDTSVEEEISHFEEKLNDDVENPKPAQHDDLRSRISSIIRPKKMGLQSDAEIKSQSSMPENAPGPEHKTIAKEFKIELRSRHAPIAEEQGPTDVPIEDSSSQEDVGEIEVDVAPKRVELKKYQPISAASREVTNLSTSEKLNRLHSKLQEMKSALKSLSDGNGVAEAQVKKMRSADEGSSPLRIKMPDRKASSKSSSKLSKPSTSKKSAKIAKRR